MSLLVFSPTPAGAVVTTDGAAAGWGGNRAGQLGFTSTPPGSTACGGGACSLTVAAAGAGAGMGRLKAISAGDDFSIGVDVNGDVWGWGASNLQGSLGQGAATGQGGGLAPTRIHGVGDVGTLGGVKAVASSLASTVALKTDGTLVAWGYDESGQLGDGTDARDVALCRCRLTPVPVVGPNGTGLLGDGTATPPIQAIAAGYYHSMALDTAGHVWAWGAGGPANGLGDNVDHNNTCLLRGGIVPDNVRLNCSMTPVEVVGTGGTGLLVAKAISGGGWVSSYALLTDGTVRAWGDNEAGGLGNGTFVDSPVPVQVLQGTGVLTGITSIAGGRKHAVAVKGTGATSTAWAWGANAVGEIGDNSIVNRNTAVQVKGVGGVGFLTGIRSVAASRFTDNSGSSSYAVTNAGAVWGWGYAFSGQLGDNTRGDVNFRRLAPVKAKGSNAKASLGGVLDMAVGSFFAIIYAIPADLSLACSSPCPTSVPKTTVATYVLAVTANGPDTVAGTLAAPIPAGASFSAVTPPAGVTCTKPAVGASSGTISCPLGSIPIGTTKTVTIKLKAVGAIGSNIVFKPTLGGNFFDASSADNAPTFTTSITA